MMKEILKITGIYSFVLICIILIVLFPRTPKVGVEPGWGGVLNVEEEQFMLEEYKDNIVTYVKSVYENNSLGGTKWPTRSAEDEILKYMPRSLAVLGLGFILSMLIGFWKGIYDFRASKSKLNVVGNGSTWLFQSIPDYFIAICVIWLFWFFAPFSIMGSMSWYKFIAPGILVSISPMFYIARITNVALVTQEHEPFVQVAASKGLTKKLILSNHLMRHCFISLSNHLPSIMVFLLSNLLVVEYLIGYEGAAYRLFSAIGYTNEIVPSFVSDRVIVDESGLIIGISICFLLLVMIAHVIGNLVKYRFEPK
ncbi:ABC transporter permease subunit [Fredinandcohnia sp. 179-A 10B2 NHS]|uniref:ABC transporter permease subunit n=1 Tax=Fredinandcohnia sp. 179-A 10B2 NHS TaxID=3235176 RepID=UPI00399F9800